MTDEEVQEAVAQARVMLKSSWRHIRERRVSEALVHLARENRLLKDRIGLLERLNGGGK